MTIVRLFKPGRAENEIDMRELDDKEQRNHVERFMAAGYLKNPDLVCMYHPDTKKQIFCIVPDRAYWEAMGYFATPTWVYHPKEAPKGKIVSNEMATRMYADGWYDSPGKFPGGKLGVEKARDTLVMPKEKVA